MIHQELTILGSLLEPKGDLKKPIPPGKVFGTLRSETEIKRTQVGSGTVFPPISSSNPGCRFDAETNTLQATIWGKAVFVEDGIKVVSTWDVSDDKMTLGAELDYKDFEDEIVTVGRLLEALPKEFEALKDKVDTHALVAGLERSATTGKRVKVAAIRGTPAQPGQDARLDLTFSTSQGVGVLREDGTMDFRERASLPTVGEQDLLGTLVPPVQGSPGQDIFGVAVRPAEPRKVKVNIGQGVETVPGENGIVVYKATRVGVARFRNNVLEVSDLLKIEGNVDLKSGNIRAQHGSVHITGDVTSGFKVESSGDVIVDGVVEEADIIAGGLVVVGGVIMTGRNKIVAHGNVSAGFFRNADVEAGGDVSTDLEFSHSRITAGGEVTALGSKGIISGGHIISSVGIHAKVIGNKASVETIVEIRVVSPEEKVLDASKKQLEDELENLTKAIGSEDALASLMNAPEEDRRILAELIKVRGAIQTHIRNIDESIKAERAETAKALASKRIKADELTFGGTEVIIGGKHFTVEKEMESPSFHLDFETQRIVHE